MDELIDPMKESGIEEEDIKCSICNMVADEWEYGHNHCLKSGCADYYFSFTCLNCDKDITLYIKKGEIVKTQTLPTGYNAINPNDN
jgi:hypothetical protein